MSPRITIFPLPEPGHIHPTLEIARHYAATGFDVVYLTAPQFGSLVGSVGARVTPIFGQEDDNAEASGQRLWYRFSSQPSAGRKRRRIEAIIAANASEEPSDLYLFDHHLATSFQCELEKAAGKTPVLLFATALLSWDEPNLEQLNSTMMTLCPRAFEVASCRDRGVNLTYVEPSVFLGKAQEADQCNLLRSGAPLVVVTWGTQSIRYPRLHMIQTQLVEIARRHQDIDFVVAAPLHLKLLLQLGDLPANLVWRESVQQRELLLKASLLITHGGLNSIKEAVLANVPLLVLPFVTDQPYNALRVERNGIGSALFPEEQTVARLERAILASLARVTSPALQEMCAVFRSAEVAKPSHAIINLRLR